MTLRHAPAILLGRAVRAAARVRKPGGGSAIPGLIVNRVAPGFLTKALASFPDGLVIVSGSSGKSTTTKMLVAILEAHGRRVFTNPSTANIAQGLTSALLERARLSGRIDADIAVLEMDEGHGARIAPSLTARLVVLLNVMTDQIDRFFDSEKVQQLLERMADRTTEALVTNADDALLEVIAARASVDVDRFGVSAPVWADSPRGLGYARSAEHRLTEGTIVTSVNGRNVTMTTPGVSRPLRLTVPAKGVHYAIDAAAAVAASRRLLGEAFDADLAATTITHLAPVFGRGEIALVRGKRVEFVLVQNPASYQLNVDALDEQLDQVFVAMGSDVRDPGYFWPVDPKRIGRARIVSGSKAHECALHLGYRGVTIDRIDTDLSRAIDDFMALPDPTSGVKTMIFTADAMRRTRAHLGIVS